MKKQSRESNREPQWSMPRGHGDPMYLVRWLTRDSRVREEKARGMGEMVAIVSEIEAERGDLLVACATFFYSIT